MTFACGGYVRDLARRTKPRTLEELKYVTGQLCAALVNVCRLVFSRCEQCLEVNRGLFKYVRLLLLHALKVYLFRNSVIGVFLN